MPKFERGDLVRVTRASHARAGDVGVVLWDDGIPEPVTPMYVCVKWFDTKIDIMLHFDLELVDV